MILLAVAILFAKIIFSFSSSQLGLFLFSNLEISKAF